MLSQTLSMNPRLSRYPLMNKSNLTQLVLGSLLLCLSAQPAAAQAPANDAFANAISLPPTASGSTTGSNRDATVEIDEPDQLADYSGKTVWWKWTAPANGRYVFHTTGSSFDTFLVVFSGTDLTSLTLVALSDDAMAGTQSSASFEAVAGTTYHLVIDGYGLRGFGNIKLAWLLQPTLVYTWREDFTSEGAEPILNEFDEVVGVDWLPKFTFVETGLVVRGRSEKTTTPVYGQERGPVAKFVFYPVRVGSRTVRYFTITLGNPIEVPAVEPGDPPTLFGGFYSTLTQYKPRPILVREDVASEFYSLDENDELLFNSGIFVNGTATARAPFAGAPKTWFASTLRSDTTFADPILSGFLPNQGEPEYGVLNRLRQTMIFSPSFTARVKDLEFTAAVAALRQYLLDINYIEGLPPE